MVVSVAIMQVAFSAVSIYIVIMHLTVSIVIMQASLSFIDIM